ncbi:MULTISPECIES: condensation domain-containing protein [Mycobacterium]|uniref:condensation domain-containing protein n=1 Tax=Mycobacterium TaxID=1763 RepID=UPI0004452D67|nr:MULTISPECIES: condensation domain-containing protein [Mycobacterium]EUA28207.1 condensation domain protein [Mycobacterium intracellulare]UQB91503.1 peptide synthetase [Mycobacterium intracellulare]WSE47805.1 condensation domain-containing protein [Mycobacterium sp. 3-98]
MTSERIAAQPTGELRALGLRERCLYRYSERNPLLFVLVAEFDVALDPDLVGDALDAVQRRHPLLSAHVHEDHELGPVFYRADPATPIELSIHRDPDQGWHVFAAQELARPFGVATVPLMRATLLARRTTSTLLLTFDHVISDGISSVAVLDDLLAALNGEWLPVLPVPESLEDLAARRFEASDIGDVSAELGDPRMAVPTRIRPFDATPPYVHGVVMDRGATAHLLERCRNEDTTVHAAIVTAASRVRSAECGDDFVRAYSPINARELVAQEPGCCLCISFACTGMAPADGTAFWRQARETGDRLKAMRSPAGLMLGSAVIEDNFPFDADCDTAEQFLCTHLPSELTITNLGVQAMSRVRPIRPRTIWGPVVLTQIEREYVTGVVTYDGHLRMVTCGYTPTERFLEAVRETLTDAPGYPR